MSNTSALINEAWLYAMELGRAGQHPRGVSLELPHSGPAPLRELPQARGRARRWVDRADDPGWPR